MSLEEMETILREWESMDGVKWDEDTRIACSAFVETSSLSFAEWKTYLIKVPDDVNGRYRKVMQLLLDKKRIDQAAFDAEMEAMAMFSPALLTRRGKEFADWYRNAY